MGGTKLIRSGRVAALVEKYDGIIDALYDKMQEEHTAEELQEYKERAHVYTMVQNDLREVLR